MKNLPRPRLPDWWRYNRWEECQEGQWQKHHSSEDPSWYQYHMSLWKGRHIETSSPIHHQEAAVWYSGFSQSLVLPPALWASLRKARLSWGKVSLYCLLRQKRDGLDGARTSAVFKLAGTATWATAARTFTRDNCFPNLQTHYSGALPWLIGRRARNQSISLANKDIICRAVR